MQLPRDASGLLAREQQLHPALPAVEIAKGEKPPQGFSARGDLGLELLALPRQRLELLLRRCASAGEGAQRPVGFGNCTLGVPQLVANLGAAFFAFRDFRAQSFDSRSKRVELLRLALRQREN